MLNYMLFIFASLDNSISRGRRAEVFQLKGLYAEISRFLLISPEWHMILLLCVSILLGTLGYLSLRKPVKDQSRNPPIHSWLTIYIGCGLTKSLAALLIISLVLAALGIPGSYLFDQGYPLEWIQWEVWLSDVLPLEPLIFLLIFQEFILTTILLLLVVNIPQFLKANSQLDSDEPPVITLAASLMLMAYVSLYFFMRIDDNINSAASNQAIVRFFSGIMNLQIFTVILIQSCLLLLPILALSSYYQYPLISHEMKNRLERVLKSDSSTYQLRIIPLIILSIFGFLSIFFPYLIAGIFDLRFSVPVDLLYTPLIFLGGCVLSYGSYRILSNRSQDMADDT
ncbi:MAG: hypothetical protein ACFFFG_01550 [Candidatus Thorarchaeota archaeon]